MTNDKNKSAATILVIVDVAKLGNVMLIEQPSKSRQQSLKINNTDTNLRRLVD